MFCGHRDFGLEEVCRGKGRWLYDSAVVHKDLFLLDISMSLEDMGTVLPLLRVLVVWSAVLGSSMKCGLSPSLRYASQPRL